MAAFAVIIDMNTVGTILPGQVTLYRGVKKPSALARAWQQATTACGQFLDRVGIDHSRNTNKRLSKTSFFLSWLFAGRKETIRFRDRAWEKHGPEALLLLARFEVENYFRILRCRCYFAGGKPIPIRSLARTEKLGRIALVAMIASCSSLTGNATRQQVQSQMIAPVTQAIESIVAPGPKNWLDGIPEANGFRKDALSGPLQYAKDSGFEFAATKKRLLELVEEGTLVELEETASLKFNNVSRPYVLPVAAEFVYRLADQYNYGQRCGPLVLNGAARDVAFQRSLGNGSEKSVHPAGMSVDFKSTGHSPRCQTWLEGTFLEIEAARRIDYTKEVSKDAPHYHVTVAIHEYEDWLEKRRTVNNTETDTLRTAMFYEGGSDESTDGYRAIGWVIRNRVSSEAYPNTIQAVVEDGSTGKHNGGCQFSYECDGKPEDRYELCRTETGKLTSYWRFKCDMRWEKVTMIAKAVMTETNDPTGGALNYYASYMDEKGITPPWGRTMTNRRSFGNHVFGNAGGVS